MWRAPNLSFWNGHHQTLFLLLILSYPDDCNSLLIGLPASSLTPKPPPPLLLLLASGTWISSPCGLSLHKTSVVPAASQDMNPSAQRSRHFTPWLGEKASGLHTQELRSQARQLGFEFQLCHLPTGTPWTRYSTPLSLNFLFPLKNREMTVPISGLC